MHSTKPSSMAGVIMFVAILLLEQLAGSTPINTGVCEVHEQDTKLTQHHLRFYYYTLPQDLADKLHAIGGEYHGLWDGWIHDAWPVGFNKRRERRPDDLRSEAMRECTFGRLFATNQFSAGYMWRPHIMASPLRVDNVEHADVVLVDLVDDILFSFDNGHYAQTSGLGRVALNHINEHFKKTNKPHIIPLSRHEQVYQNPHEGGGLLRGEEASKFTWLSYEITDWEGWGIKAPGKAPKEGPLNFTYYNVLAQPYPSTLHMSAHDKYFTYLKHLQQADSESSADSKEPCWVARKKVLASGSYTARFPLRRELKRQCLLAGPTKCRHVEVGFNDLVPKLQTMHDTYGSSWFCLMPPGDTHSRRSFVDCLLEDAIPVIFKNWTYNTIPFSDILDPKEYVVNLSDLEPSLSHLGTEAMYQNKDFKVMVRELAQARRDVLSLVRRSLLVLEARDVLGLLEQRYPLDVRKRMVSHIFKIKHLFQMMLNPVHEVVRFDQLDEVSCLDDKFTASLKAALRSLCRRGQLPAARCAGQ